jgi:hypothetical protein
MNADKKGKRKKEPMVRKEMPKSLSVNSISPLCKGGQGDFCEADQSKSP